MANKSKAAVHASKEVPQTAKCLEIAGKGIKTGHDFADFMSAMMSDLIAGRISPGIGNAACNAAGKLLKVVEMQQRYGTATPNGKILNLALQAPLLPGQEQVQ